MGRYKQKFGILIYKILYEPRTRFTFTYAIDAIAKEIK
jgi:hypothetical protein